MTPNTKAGSKELGLQIRARRESRGLTIEQAAAAAGVGSETWRRYEAGGSIRKDKVRGICKSLQWLSLPDGARDADGDSPTKELWELAAEGESYVPYLADDIEEEGARAFSLGYDFLMDDIQGDLDSLSREPRGTHIGQLGASWMNGRLPDRWIMRYDYEFLFRFRAVVHELLLRLRHPAYDGVPHLIRRVVDDLALVVVLRAGAVSLEDRVEESDPDEWAYVLNGEDDEVHYMLFDEHADPEPDSQWHFDHWFDLAYWGLDKAQDQMTGPATDEAPSVDTPPSTD